MLKLQNRSVIKVGGPDAQRFLHNITTNNVADMCTHSTLYNLILNSKGRYVFDFFLTRCDGYFLIECENADAVGIAEILKNYRLKLKVRIKICDEYVVYLDPNQNIGEEGHTLINESGVIVYQDPRKAVMGTRILQPLAQEEGNSSTGCGTGDYHKLRVANTIPECSSEMLRGESFPMHYSLDELNAICRNKGCYIGQEVTARMQRVGSKKRLYTIRSKTGEPLPEKGAVVQGDTQVGQVISVIEEMGLCVLEVERVVCGGCVKIGHIECEIKT
ncbi:CAF17-like 4Fe-4S cluster assembly/insertion protein YgfZ [Anaplasma bovis]|uniref:CAF17-like 4Fe-4S cluster assembly/insertion protein YgfZ n=1 Tax=Anaplasma bovis TaxID=186733 RepID=UPI002FF3B853